MPEDNTDTIFYAGSYTKPLDDKRRVSLPSKWRFKGDDADKEKIESLQNDYQKLYEEIMKNENMEAYSAAAAQMEDMAQYISKMIGLFFDGEDPETCRLPEEDCTHNCSTCGCGCGI